MEGVTHTTTSMKFSLAVFALASFLLAGCQSNSGIRYSDEKRAPTKSVELFRENRIPPRPYKEIGEVTVGEYADGERQAIEELLKQAKRQGADIILLQPR